MKKSLRVCLLAAGVAVVGLGCVTVSQDGAGYVRSSALPAPPDPADNPTTPEKAALGKQLFFDPRLSGDGSMACQGCHYRHLGWTDGLPLSRKVGGGMNTRHTPSVYNTGYYTSWYWDGRAKTLEGSDHGRLEGSDRCRPGQGRRRDRRRARLPGWVPEGLRRRAGRGQHSEGARRLPAHAQQWRGTLGSPCRRRHEGRVRRCGGRSRAVRRQGRLRRLPPAAACTVTVCSTTLGSKPARRSRIPVARR
jgi:hypothetical protein